MFEQIIQLIETSETKSISYSEFMERALYDQKNGYYMKEKSKIGKAGDFYTNSNIHSVFGKVLAKRFVELTKAEKLPECICEIGAGTGRLANFILNEWKEIEPESFQNLQYYIVEMSPYHRKIQRETIGHFEKIKQFATIEEMRMQAGRFTGIVLSNELFDAFPTDVIQKEAGTIYEVRIAVDEQKQLVERLIPCQNEELLSWLEEYHVALVDGQRIEVPIAMIKWIEQTKSWFDKGLMLTIDYGYTNEEWSEPIHSKGSLRGYFNHQMIENPLLYPGDMDLTTHVHLDAIKKKGNEVGLLFVDMLKQHQFLLRAGILQYLNDHYDPNPFSEVSKQNRAIRTLLLDGGISSAFTVILQQKGLADLTSKKLLPYETL